MAGRLTLQARKDWKRIIESGGFEEDIIFKTPDSFVSNPAQVTVQGLATKHNLQADTDGNAVSAKNVHITVNEEALVSQGYPVRNSDEEVSLIDHKIDYTDSTGILKNYVVLECFPDETVGVITCILGDYKE